MVLAMGESGYPMVICCIAIEKTWQTSSSQPLTGAESEASYAMSFPFRFPCWLKPHDHVGPPVDS